MTKQAFIEKATRGYPELVQNYAEYMRDPSAMEQKYAWNIINNPCSHLHSLSTYGRQTPKSVEEYAAQVAHSAEEAYEFAEKLPRHSRWRRLLWRITYLFVERYYWLRRHFAWNLGPGTIGPFHPAPHLCASTQYRYFDLAWQQASMKRKVLAGVPIEQVR